MLMVVVFGAACQRERTNIEELELATGHPPVPVGQGESANVRAREAGNVAGSGTIAGGGFGATSNQLATSGGAVGGQAGSGPSTWQAAAAGHSERHEP